MNRELRQLVKTNCAAWEASGKDFAALYEITFANGERIMGEANDGFRITRYTYRQVKVRIEAVSAALYERIGAQHSYVALEMENSIDWIVAFWAILRSGNKPYLVNLRHPKHLTENLLHSLHICYVVSDKPVCHEGCEWLDITALKSETPFAGLFEDEIALSTSATSLHEVICYYTGARIGAQIMNVKGILKANATMADHVDGSLKNLAFLPFYHIFGLLAVYFWFTFFGRTLVFLSDYAPDTILKTCRRHGVTHIFAVPMLWHTVEKSLYKELKKQSPKKQKAFEKGVKLCTALQNLWPRFGRWVSGHIMSEVQGKVFGDTVRFCISGGSYIKDSALATINGIGYPLYNGFGMTEIGISSVELRHRPKDRNLNAIGRPFDSVCYRINADSTLSVKGDSLCARMTVNGEEREIPEWFNTCDVAREEKGYYYIIGRQSDRVIGENGENIDPDQIERLFELAHVNRISVLGLDKEGAEVLSLVAEVSPYLSGEAVGDIIRRAYEINDTLPTTSQVRQFFFTHQPIAPETAIKVGRAFLRRALAEGQVTLTPFGEMKGTDTGEELNPRLLERIRVLVAEVLELPVDAVGDEDHFIHQLGAGSLEYFSILTALSDEFGTSFTDGEQYRYTVAELCRYIQNHL